MNLGKDISTKHDIDISIETLRKGLYISGKPGQGKSALLGNLINEVLEQGHGLCFLDPHGDQAEAAADNAPDNRFWRDVVYWEPWDTSHIIGYNPLKDIEKDKRPLVAQQVFASGTPFDLQISGGRSTTTKRTTCGTTPYFCFWTTRTCP